VRSRRNGQYGAVRVERSFAFLDLCGFTSFTSIEGDDRATRVLAGFRSAVREIASRRGVRVAKWLGDGAMVVAVEPEPLVSAVLEVEQRVDDGRSALPLRAGMAHGQVILFEGDDYIGSPVNLAARLCDVSGPREVLAVSGLGAHCPPWVVAGEPYDVVVPGFGGTVEIVRISRRPPGDCSVVDPVCGLVLPRDAVGARLTGPSGVIESFCSEACLASWSDSHPSALAVAEP